MFGGRSPVGFAFEEILKKKVNHLELIKYSRKKNNSEFKNFDISNKKILNDVLEDETSTIISFMPVWALAKFLENLAINNPKFLKSLNKVILCSSSSAITKKYAFNSFDKTLSRNLIKSENKIIDLGIKFNFKTIIIQPSMVYGSYGKLEDKNISFLKKLMRFFPFIFLPYNCGKRQPIHCVELAEVFYKFLENDNKIIHLRNSRLLIGGDFEISYQDMLLKLQKSSAHNDNLRRCKLILIPDFIFIIFSLPLALFSLKLFEANLRILSDLSEFVHQNVITQNKTDTFPNSIYKNE